MINKIKLNRYIKNIFIISIILLNINFIIGASIYLNKNAEVKVNDASSLDGFSQATWNMWVKQDLFNNNAGIVGKYSPSSGARSYLLRTNYDGINVVISSDGSNVGSYTSSLSRSCGITSNNWTMVTVTYNGSIITYYKNGKRCDQDSTSIRSIYNSYSPVRFGGGNNVYFNGEIDEYIFYKQELKKEQVERLYNESMRGKNLGQSIPVLVYHDIRDPADNSITVSTSQFRSQMEYLKKNGFRPVTLRHYENWRKGTYNMPKKAVILVFDDGFASVYNNAKPIMDFYGFKGSIIAVDRYASSTTSTRYMKWNQLTELSNLGWSIESHGLTHSHMLSLNESQFRNELSLSKKIITNKTGKTPNSFVFPFHEANSAYTKICGEYYSLCWTQGSVNPGYNYKSTNGKEYLSLRRINIVNYLSLSDFANYLSKDTNKVGEWMMEEGSGNVTYDISGRGNTGYLLNGASWSRYATTFSRSASTVPQIAGSDKPIDKIIESDNRKSYKIKKEKTYPDVMNIEGEFYDSKNFKL